MIVTRACQQGSTAIDLKLDWKVSSYVQRHEILNQKSDAARILSPPPRRGIVDRSLGQEINRSPRGHKYLPSLLQQDMPPHAVFYDFDATFDME